MKAGESMAEDNPLAELRQQFIAATTSCGELHNVLTVSEFHRPIGERAPEWQKILFFGYDHSGKEDTKDTPWVASQLLYKLIWRLPRAGNIEQGYADAVFDGDKVMEVMRCHGFYTGESSSFDKFKSLGSIAGHYYKHLSTVGALRLPLLIQATLQDGHFTHGDVAEALRRHVLNKEPPPPNLNGSIYWFSDLDIWVHFLHYLAAEQVSPIIRCEQRSAINESQPCPYRLDEFEFFKGMEGTAAKNWARPNWYWSRLEQNVFQASAEAIRLLLNDGGAKALVSPAEGVSPTRTDSRAFRYEDLKLMTGYASNEGLYAHMDKAGVPRPTKGKRNHAFTLKEIRQILIAVVAHGGDAEVRNRAMESLQSLKI
ncbi:MAG TPA: hypothetical protein VGG19_02985 [Tepidisphaeraceae bacterium]|jgi:hypothetical protein